MKSLTIAGLSILLLVLFFQCCPSGTTEGPSVTPEAEDTPTVPAEPSPVPTDTPLPVPTSTPEPAPTLPAGFLEDYLYVECLVSDVSPISEQMSITLGQLGESLGAQDWAVACAIVPPWQAEMEAMRSALTDCPSPSDASLYLGKEYYLQGLDELVEAAGLLEEACHTTDQGARLIYQVQAIGYLNNGHELIVRGTDALSSYTPPE